MKKVFLGLVLVCVASLSAFAGSGCPCGGDKKEGEKGKDATKQTEPAKP